MRRVAGLAGGCDARTVETYLDGSRATLTPTRCAIERALRTYGRGDLVRPEPVRRTRGRVTRQE